MKNIVSLFLALVISVNYLNAQYVTIPDSNFVNFLNIYYANCMNGNQMDTTCLKFKQKFRLILGWHMVEPIHMASQIWKDSIF